MTIKHDNEYGTTYIFEVVEKIPEGFSIWAISGIGNGEYTPICETVRPNDKNCYDVNTQTLKAIKQSMERLIEQWELTSICENENIATVRGWLMEEIEKRNPGGFNAWLDNDDCDDFQLKKYVT
jgi:hypothetical protein